MKFIRATVDVVLDRFYPGRSPSNRHRYNRPHDLNVLPSNRIDEDAGEQVEKVRFVQEINQDAAQKFSPFKYF